MEFFNSSWSTSGVIEVKTDFILIQSGIKVIRFMSTLLIDTIFDFEKCTLLIQDQKNIVELIFKDESTLRTIYGQITIMLNAKQIQSQPTIHHNHLSDFSPIKIVNSGSSILDEIGLNGRVVQLIDEIIKINKSQTRKYMDSKFNRLKIIKQKQLVLNKYLQFLKQGKINVENLICQVDHIQKEIKMFAVIHQEIDKLIQDINEYQQGNE